MTTAQSGPFVRAARFVGDFGNPFYDEERQRDVWNEASAFGFQLALVTTLLFSTVCIWLVGRPALPYVQLGLGLTGAIGGATILYAQRLGVDVLQPQRLNRARTIPVGMLLAVLIAGMVRASSSTSSWSWSSAAGAATGLAVVAAAFSLTRHRSRQAAQRSESEG